jgi:flagellar biosynthesis/type III secretory pathway protein FliH
MGHLVKGLGHVVPAAVVDATEEATRIRARAEEDAAALRMTVHKQVEAAKQAGFAEGRDAGLAEVAALLLAARAQGDRDLATAKDTALVLARRMAEKIVGRAIDLSPELMNQIVAQALASCRARSGKIVLRVHPEDLASIEAGRPQWAAAVAATIDVRVLPDATVEHGGCVVDTPSGRVDARLQTQLDALERALRAVTETGKDQA